MSNADDLSDVSDLDDSDGLDGKDEEQNTADNVLQNEEKILPEDQETVSEKNFMKENTEKEAREKAKKERQERENKASLNIDDGEQLDFEAEDQPEVNRKITKNFSTAIKIK